MSLKIVCVTINTGRPRELADWWMVALGGEVTADHGEHVFATAGQVSLSFQRAERSGPNHLHLDLAADDRAAEVRRLVGLGARHVADREAPGITWTVLTDLDGNSFCVSDVEH